MIVEINGRFTHKLPINSNINLLAQSHEIPISLNMEIQKFLISIPIHLQLNIRIQNLVLRDNTLHMIADAKGRSNIDLPFYIAPFTKINLIKEYLINTLLDQLRQYSFSGTVIVDGQRIEIT